LDNGESLLVHFGSFFPSTFSQPEWRSQFRYKKEIAHLFGMEYRFLQITAFCVRFPPIPPPMNLRDSVFTRIPRLRALERWSVGALERWSVGALERSIIFKYKKSSLFGVNTELSSLNAKTGWTKPVLPVPHIFPALEKLRPEFSQGLFRFRVAAPFRRDSQTGFAPCFIVPVFPNNR